MSCETLKVQRDGPVMTVRLNRPEKRNPINHAYATVCKGVIA